MSGSSIFGNVEDSKRRAETGMAIITHSIPHLISYIDTNYVYQFVNKAYEKWFDVKAEDLIGKSIAELTGETAFNEVKHYLDRAISGHEVTFEAEMPYLHGGQRFVHATYTPDYDDSGKVRGIFAVVANMTRENQARQKILTDEAQFRTIFNAAAVGMVQANAETMKLINVNDYFCTLTGYSREELVGMEFQKLTLPVDQKTCWPAFEAMLDGRAKTYNTEKRYLTKDGKINWVSVAATLLPKNFYDEKRIVIIVQDITARKNAEETLKRSEERFSLAISASKLGFWDWDLATDHLEWNEFLRRDWGFKEGQLSGSLSEAMEKVHPDDHLTVLKEIASAQAMHKPYDVVFRVLKAEHEIVWIRAQGLVHSNSEGHPIRMTGTSLDITESKTAEKILKDREEQFRLLTETIPQGIWRAEPNGSADYFSQRFLDTVGYELTEMLGWGWSEAIHPEDRHQVLTEWQRCRELGLPVSVEFRLKTRNKGYRWFMSMGNPFHNSEGRIVKYYGTWTDIHDMKLARASAEKANSAKSTFLANMSHEIRTPMTAVLGFTEVLRDPNLSEKDRIDAVSRIEKSGRALLRLIDDILDISKIEAGKLNIDRTRFSPVEIVTEVVSLLRLQAELKGINIVTEFEDSVPDIAYSDPLRLRQILTNLVGNAIKFTNEGTVTVHVTTDDTEHLVISVIDTGIGVSTNDQDKLFQPFAQADGSITRQFGGTGLGLILSKRLAEQLGGDLVLANSRPGQGSEFVIRIKAGPFDKMNPSEHRSFKETVVAKDLRPDRDFLHGARILVAEDIADNQVLLRRYLESAGAYVDLAGNGAEAVVKATHRRYDLVLMDVQMPHVDGIQATQKLRSVGYDRPILALTAHAMPEEVARSIEAGCNEHLTKPIAKVGSSRVDLQACKLEYSIVSPK